MSFSLKFLSCITLMLVLEAQCHGHHWWGHWGSPRRVHLRNRSYSPRESRSSSSSSEDTYSSSESNEEKSCNPWISRTLESLRAQVLYLERNIEDNCREDVLSNLCKSNYDYAAGRCYRLSRIEMDWHKARFNCTMEGGDLIALETPLEEQALTEYIVHKEGFKYQRFHTSGNEQEYKGLWHWGLGPDAFALTYENWSKSEPNDHNGEDEECIEYRPLGGWNDIICKQERRFICELPPTYNKKIKQKPVNKTQSYKNVIPYNIPAPPVGSSESSLSDSSSSSSSSPESGPDPNSLEEDRRYQGKPNHKLNYYTHRHGDYWHNHVHSGPHRHSSDSDESESSEEKRSRKYGDSESRPHFHGSSYRTGFSHRGRESQSTESSESSNDSHEGSYESARSRDHPGHHHHYHGHPHHYHGPPHYRRHSHHHHHPSPYEYFKHKYYSLFKKFGHHPWKKHWYHPHHSDPRSSHEYDSRERHMKFPPGSPEKVLIMPVHIFKRAKNQTKISDARSDTSNRGPNSVSPYANSGKNLGKNTTGNYSTDAFTPGKQGIYVYSYVPPHNPQRIYYPALGPMHHNHNKIPPKKNPPHPSIYHLHYTSYSVDGKTKTEETANKTTTDSTSTTPTTTTPTTTTTTTNGNLTGSRAAQTSIEPTSTATGDTFTVTLSTNSTSTAPRTSTGSTTASVVDPTS